MPRPVVRAARPEEEEAILAVWVARDVADSGAPDYSLDDVRTDFASEEIEVLVVEGGPGPGGIVGVAALEDRGAMAAIHPDHEHGEAGAALRDALEERARARGADVMRLHVSGANAAGKAVLAEAGYAPAFYFVKLRAEAAELPTAAPVLPGGRPFRSAADDRAVHEVVREAFADIPGDIASTYEQFRVELLDRPGFAPDLSSVVEDGGRVVGCVLCERRESNGYVADLAVVREARGRGLGRGLLATALAGIRAAGLDGGELWVNGANSPALGLYESLGLREVTRQERWERSLG
jgi:mycothiol synthase